jgi:hypothetical protein
LRVRPTPERPLSPWVISTVSHRPAAIAAAVWQTRRSRRAANRIDGGVGTKLDLRHVGDDAQPGGLGGADNGDAICAIVSLDVA